MNTCSKKYKALFFIGTRPECIKLFPLIEQMKRHDYFNPIVVSTGQHGDILINTFNDLGIKVDYQENVLEPLQSLNKLHSKLFLISDNIIKLVLPDIVITQGDTATTWVCSTSSYFAKVPVAHLEAGFRTYNLKNPFPEEGNRQLIARICDINFSPTKISKDNLLSEGIKTEKIKIVGNTIVDSVRIILEPV